MYSEISDYNAAQCLHKAILFAEKAHRGQTWKGSDVSYIVHSMEVLQILEGACASIEVKLAGILHDCLENTPAVYEDIVEEFGEDVAKLAAVLTTDKSRPWRERKAVIVERAERADFDEQLIIMADVISNMRMLLLDYREKGEALWDDFSVSKDDMEWYYNKVQDAIFKLADDVVVKSIYWEMVDLFKEIFVRFFQVDDQYIIQATANEVHMYNPKDQDWYDISDQICLEELLNVDGCVEISQELAEQMEDILTVGLVLEKQAMFDDTEDKGHN